jgi:general secretion pathway protein F
MIVEGTIDAVNEKAAIDNILKSGTILLSISPLNKKYQEKTEKKSSKRDVQIFTSELSVLLGSGMPLDRSLLTLSKVTESKDMKKVVQSILKYIREGKSFSDSLLMHPQTFSKFYINMIKAGEASGSLDEILNKLNEFLESTQELKEHIFSAMIYPTILIVTSIMSIMVLLIFVVPRFSLIFSDLGGALPIPTKMLIFISEGLLSYWWIFVLLIFTGLIIFKNCHKSEENRYKWDAFTLKLMGNVIKKLETARFCRTLGTLLKSGVPLLQALNNSKDVVNNQVISRALNAISKEAKEGKGIAAPLSSANVFEPLALSMIKVGEETGQLENMLIKIASAYEKNLKESIKRFVSILESVMILSLGLIIGFIVLSMLMAIFSIVDLPL